MYAAGIRHCRPCSLREQCQWNGSATAKPLQVSVLLHPLRVGPAPLLWRDWSRRLHRRRFVITAPTLVIAGDNDAFAARPEVLAASIPNARSLLLPGDHLSVVLTPQFASAIVEFLAA